MGSVEAQGVVLPRADSGWEKGGCLRKGGETIAEAGGQVLGSGGKTRWLVRGLHRIA